MRPLRTIIKRLLIALGLKPWADHWYRAWRWRDYARWTRRTERSLIDELSSPTEGPLISIIVPSHKYVHRYLAPLLDSLRAQKYANWELVLVNACEDAVQSRQISQLLTVDSRMREVKLAKNLHIAGNTNAGIEAAHGEFVALLDHDDILAPHALSEAVKILIDRPDVDALYSDEDKLSDDAKQRFYPFFKATLTLEQYLTSNFMCHLTIVRTPLARAVGGIRSEFDGSQDYDFWLRLIDAGARIAHVPVMSYHWRLAEGSTAGIVASKSYASEASKRALIDHIERQKLAATVTDFPGQASTFRLHYQVPAKINLLIVGNETQQTAEFHHQLKAAGFPIVWLSFDAWRTTTLAADTTHVLFVGQALNPSSADWLSELLGKSSQPGVGLVLAQIRDEAKRTRAGYVLSDGRLEPTYGNYEHEIFTYEGLTGIPKAALTVDLDCTLVLSKHLDGLEPKRRAAMAPHELGLWLHAQGLRNVYWPFALLERAGTWSSAELSPLERTSTAHDLVPATDPYLNPNLAYRGGQPILR